MGRKRSCTQVREPGGVRAVVGDGVGGPAEQCGHQGAQALVGDAGDGEHAGTQGAGQGLDPRVAEPQGRGPPAILGDGGLRDPLKGWTRKDAALTDTFSIEQCGVDRTRPELQLVKVGQPAPTAHIVWVVDHRLDAQCPPVRRVGPAGCPADPPSEPYVPLVAAYGSSKPRGRAGWCWCPALAGMEPASAGGVHEASWIIVRWAGSPVVDEVVRGDRLTGDAQPPPFPVVRGLRRLIGGQ